MRGDSNGVAQKRCIIHTAATAIFHPADSWDSVLGSGAYNEIGPFDTNGGGGRRRVPGEGVGRYPNYSRPDTIWPPCSRGARSLINTAANTSARVPWNGPVKSFRLWPFGRTVGVTDLIHASQKDGVFVKKFPFT